MMGDSENEELLENWSYTFAAAVGKAPLEWVINDAWPNLVEMQGLKFKFIIRKLACEITVAIPLGYAEKAFQESPKLLGNILSMCRDNNFKIRGVAVVFMQKYLVTCTQEDLDDIFYPELADLVQDFELYGRIDAL